MKILHDISPQRVSWVKSNRFALEKCSSIKSLYYPETTNELVELISNLRRKNDEFDIIGYSSNTLFLPSYKIKNLICTKELKSWRETDNYIICECGVNVSLLSKEMIKKGYIGFEGLTDLPGTVAAAVYGNAGCRGCSINGLLHSFIFLKEDGSKEELTVEDLKLEYRSTSLKRKELKGVIVEVVLCKEQGDPTELQQIADKNHSIRKREQPKAANNLGTTFIGNNLTRKGLLLFKIERALRRFMQTNDIRKTLPWAFKLIGAGKYAPYIYYWNRYMFLDEKSHRLFFKYYHFIKTIYSDVHFEIEIRK